MRMRKKRNAHNNGKNSERQIKLKRYAVKVIGKIPDNSDYSEHQSDGSDYISDSRNRHFRPNNKHNSDCNKQYAENHIQPFCAFQQLHKIPPCFFTICSISSKHGKINGHKNRREENYHTAAVMSDFFISDCHIF